MATASSISSFLLLPPELRNQIYDYIYTPPSPYESSTPKTNTVPTPSLLTFGTKSPLDRLPPSTSTNHKSALTRTCKQIHAETSLLYFSHTTFTLPGPYATPDYFARILTPLSDSQIKSIRHITLYGRINNLRALNESWENLPFCNQHLQLETLTIVPRRPQNHEPQYAEIADLSQSHVLAHVLAETLKGLKQVERVIVRNEDKSFNPGVWKVVHSQFVWKLWTWGGDGAGCLFRRDESGEDAWFEVRNCGHGAREEGWSSMTDEIQKLIV